MYVLLIVVCPFVLFLLAIVLSLLLRYTDSDYPFGIFKLFLYNNCIRNIQYTYIDLHEFWKHVEKRGFGELFQLVSAKLSEKTRNKRRSTHFNGVICDVSAPTVTRFFVSLYMNQVPEMLDQVHDLITLRFILTSSITTENHRGPSWAVIVWQLDLQLLVQSVPTTTQVIMCSTSVHGGVYSIQQYLITLVSDLRQVGGFLRVFVESGAKHHNPNSKSHNCIRICYKNALFWSIICRYPFIIATSTIS